MYELYGQQLKDRDTALCKKREQEQMDRETLMAREKQRRGLSLAGELKRLQRSRKRVVESLSHSSIVIQNRLRNDTRDCYCQLAESFEFHKNEQNCFNSFLLKLGSPKFSSLALAMTFAVGIFWVWATLGLDAVNGNSILTIAIATVALVAIDMIGFFAITGVLNSCQGFFENQKKYRTCLEIIIFGGSLLALICFMANLTMRLMETG